MNQLLLGDNLAILRQLPDASVDLVYLDPPFFSNRTYEVIWGDAGERRSFEDRWSGGMMKILCWFSLTLLLGGCQSRNWNSSEAIDIAATPPYIRQGPWHGTLALADGVKLPFMLQALSANQDQVVMRNGADWFALRAETGPGDSVTMRHPVFKAALVGRVTESSFTGYWQKSDGAKQFRVPFRLVPGLPPMPRRQPAADFSGSWAVTFLDSSASSAYAAVGVFEQKGNTVTGTFLTTTDTYTYLSGEAQNNTLRLSTFDCAHAQVFTARLQPDGSLTGTSRSEITGQGTWTARRNPAVKLSDANPVKENHTGHK